MAETIQRVLVTGANKGIGLAAVEEILGHGPQTVVILGSRDRARGAAARDTLLVEHPDWESRLELLDLDVADEASVRQARGELAERFEGLVQPLCGLVNNAGIGMGADCLAPVLAVNLWGMCQVSDAMRDLLADGGRIVNVTSAAGPNFVNRCSEALQRRLTDTDASRAELGGLVTELLALEGDGEAIEKAGFGDGSAYGFSKACANLYTLILAREAPRLRVNACTPGFIETDLTRPYAVHQGKAPVELGMKPPLEGTRSILHLLFAPEPGTGHYFGSDALRSPLDRYRAPGTAAYDGS